MKPLTERYRPSAWREVIGQDKAVAICQRLIERGIGGRAVWISGASGTGKTTLAMLLAGEIADPMNVDELDAGDLTVSRLKDIERSSSTYGMGAKSGKAYVVNEAHGLRRDAIRQLLVMLERVPPHCLWVFTTTSDAQEQLFEDNEDAGPLLSRCLRVALSRQGLCKPFAMRLREIAGIESLDGQPIERYETLVKRHSNNFRAALQDIEAGAMIGN